jgi:hypothetical protein
MSKRRLMIAASLMVLLAVAAFYFFRPTSMGLGSALETPAASLSPRKHLDILPEKSAGAGGVAKPESQPDSIAFASMHAAFRTSQQCYSTARRIAVTQVNADCKFLEGKPEFQTQYAACLNNSVDHQNGIASAKAFMATCPKGADIVKNYYRATKAAAEKGDPDAQLCYLGSFFVGADGKASYTDTDVEEYMASAPGYISSAFKRGDWRIVSFLAQSNFAQTTGLFPKIQDIGQPQTVY